MKITLVVVSVIVVFLSIELISRIVTGDKTITPYRFRLQQPEPYQHSPYFSKEFIRESFHQPGEWINLPGTRIILPADYKGKYFNVENNLRVTTGAPHNFKNRILIFGGSTIYSSEVPDEYTIPSYLQQMINKNYPGTYKVVNYGVTSVNTLQQFERLQTIEINSGDIVIFYGGVNDGLLFTTGRIDGWIVGENYIEYKTRFNFIQKINYHLFNNFKDYSVFVRAFLNPFTDEIPPHLGDGATIKRLQEDLFINYTGTILSADSLCKQRGAVFYNFLQPYLGTRTNSTSYEKSLLKKKNIAPNVFLKSTEFAYQSLVTSQKYLRDKSVNTKNISGVFNNSNDSFYLDFCHVADKGNEVIATEIFNTITQEINGN